MNGISPVDTDLEAERIFQAIFRASVPSPLRNRFKLAADQLNERLSEEELDRHYLAIREAGDLEALELAGRLTGSLTTLNKRFLIMVHLAETCPGNQHYFINDRPSALRGWWALVVGGLVTAFKLGKGLFLLKRYRHA